MPRNRFSYAEVLRNQKKASSLLSRSGPHAGEPGRKERNIPRMQSHGASNGQIASEALQEAPPFVSNRRDLSQANAAQSCRNLVPEEYSLPEPINKDSSTPGSTILGSPRRAASPHEEVLKTIPRVLSSLSTGTQITQIYSPLPHPISDLRHGTATTSEKAADESGSDDKISETHCDSTSHSIQSLDQAHEVSAPASDSSASYLDDTMDDTPLKYLYHSLLKDIWDAPPHRERNGGTPRPQEHRASTSYGLEENELVNEDRTSTMASVSSAAAFDAVLKTSPKRKWGRKPRPVSLPLQSLINKDEPCEELPASTRAPQNVREGPSPHYSTVPAVVANGSNNPHIPKMSLPIHLPATPPWTPDRCKTFSGSSPIVGMSTPSSLRSRNSSHPHSSPHAIPERTSSRRHSYFQLSPSSATLSSHLRERSESPTPKPQTSRKCLSLTSQGGGDAIFEDTGRIVSRIEGLSKPEPDPPSYRWNQAGSHNALPNPSSDASLISIPSAANHPAFKQPSTVPVSSLVPMADPDSLSPISSNSSFLSSTDSDSDSLAGQNTSDAFMSTFTTSTAPMSPTGVFGSTMGVPEIRRGDINRISQSAYNLPPVESIESDEDEAQPPPIRRHRAHARSESVPTAPVKTGNENGFRRGFGDANGNLQKTAGAEPQSQRMGKLRKMASGKLYAEKWKKLFGFKGKTG